MYERRRLCVILLVSLATTQELAAQRPLYSTDVFAISDTSVEQGPFKAIARSADRIESNYQPAAIEVNFKFSINGLDNEHPPGDDYMIYLRPRGGRMVTPVYTFGMLELLNGIVPEGELNLVDNVAAPETPVTVLTKDRVTWRRVPGATSYVLYRNGVWRSTTSDTAVRVTEKTGVAEYQVLAVDRRGLESFVSAPTRVGPNAAQQMIEPDGALLDTTGSGYEGAGFMRLSTEQHTSVEIPIAIGAPAWYLVDARYANGSGPISYGYQAAVRTVLVDGQPIGALLMPQRGNNRWDDWGYTNGIRVWLTPGEHTLTIAYREANRNMDVAVNTALLDHVRVTRLAN